MPPPKSREPAADQSVFAPASPPAGGADVGLVQVGNEVFHFARKAVRKRDTEGDYAATERRRVMLLMGVLVLALAFEAMRDLGVPLILIHYALLAVFVGTPAGTLAHGFWARGRERRRLAHLPELPDEHYRIRCIGLPQDFEQFGGLVDQPFEPAIFNVSWTGLALRRAVVRRFYAVAAVFVFAGGAGALWVLGRGPTYGLPALLAPGAAYLLTAIVWHTYLRIAPGRMDILQYPVFRAGRAHCKSFDLRTARLLVNCRHGYVRLEAPDGLGKPFTMTTTLIPGRERLAYMILMAAVSTYASGPLSDKLDAA